MKTYLTKLIDNNWFFLALTGFVIVLPLSQALVSVFGGVVLGIAIIEDTIKNKADRFRKRKILLFIPAIFLIYLVSSIITGKNGSGWYDIQKTLFFLVIPMGFILGKDISNKQLRFLFYAFAFSIFVSTVIGYIRWMNIDETENFTVHRIGLISHIRFSFQLILIIWFFLLFLHKNYKKFTFYKKAGLILLIIYYLAFLLFQQSLTGLIAFGGSIAVFLFVSIFRLNKTLRILFLILAIAAVVTPVIYVAKVVNDFYDITSVDAETLPKVTKKGNFYKHDVDNPLVENGNYVYLYVCEKEMREEWNKISDFKYDSLGVNGYIVSSTLIRYLTSKGLTKDAEGVHSLNRQDIENVENGIANVIYQSRKYSLYPRIYETVWEYYVYSHTGDANNQSFSQRIEFAKAAVSIIRENPWFGVGTGKWKEEFKAAFKKNNSRLKEERYASSHNQYLNYMVKFGIIGFLLIMFFIIYPVVKTGTYRDMLFLMFLVFMFFANFADSNLESHMGSSFFIFFYCLFLISAKKDYLTIVK